MIEAITRKMAADAVKANHHAQREALPLARVVEDRAAERAAAQEQAETEQAEKEEKEREPVFSYLRDLKSSQASKWRNDQGAGLEEPAQPWPHPDDII